MDSVDAAKSKIRESESYRNALDRQTRAHEAEMQDLQKRHEVRETERRDNFLSQRDTLEKNYNDRYDSLDKKQRDALFEKERQYSKAVEDQRSEFFKTHNERKKDYENKLVDIKGEFDRTNGLQKDYHDTHIDQIVDRYKSAVQDVKKRAEADVTDFKKTAIGERKDESSTVVEEKNMLQKKHEEELNSLLKTEIKKQNDLKINAIADIDKIRANREKERISAQERQAEVFERINNTANEKVKQIKEASDERNRNLVEKQAESVVSQNKSFTDRFMQQERQFNQARREDAIKNKSLIVTPGSLQDKILKDKETDQRLQLSREKQLLIDERDKVLKDTSDLLDKARITYQEDLSDVKVATAQKIEDINWEHTAKEASQETSHRAEKADLTKTYTDQDAYNKKVTAQQIENIQDGSQQQIDRLKTTFKTSVEQLENRQEILFNQVKEEASAEKNAMAKSFKEANSDEKAQQKKRFLEKIDKLSQGYEQKIAALEIANREIKATMTAKLNELTIQMNQKLDEGKEINQKELKTEIKNQQAAARDKEMQLRKSMAQQQNNFITKMNDLRVENQNALQKLTFDYEQQLKSQQKKYQDIIDQNKRFSDRELSRLSLSSEAQKNAIITQYEEQIKQMKNLFERKEAEIEHFNKLSRA